MQPFSLILIGIITAIIGALPFGLVNLTVLDTAYQKGKRHAMNIAFGAAWIEVLFGLSAIMLGNSIVRFTSENQFIHYLILLLPAFVGFIFLFKKDSKNFTSKTKSKGFIKGIFLNLISLQVLVYWIIAITFLSSNHLVIQNRIDILLFLLGIWIGKMTVLWFYSYLSQRIFSKWRFLSLNMNRVIGSILLVTVLIQFLK
ncbi:MAG: LysE family transporter [Bacteroidales bacterium]|jgi:threonine/homoserine/homoserine lactone efflux protein|nr:LysE family transporter [Bacteroidales bacterium]